MPRKPEDVDASALPVVVYSPEPALHAPGRLLGSMWSDLKGSRELAWRLFVRDVSARYRQSLLGLLWAFVPPILTGLLFVALQSRRVLDLGPTEIPYPVYVLVGTTLWQGFADALQAPLVSISNARAMLAKVNFPREALILAAGWSVLFNLALRVVLLIGIFAYFGIPATSGLLAAAGAVVMLLLLGIAIGLLLSPLGMLYTDVSSGLTAAIQVWFFLTPVVYPQPQAFPWSMLVGLNPVTPLLNAARDLAVTGTLANPAPFLAVAGLTLLALGLGWLLYRLSMPVIIERMNA